MSENRSGLREWGIEGRISSILKRSWAGRYGYALATSGVTALTGGLMALVAGLGTTDAWVGGVCVFGLLQLAAGVALLRR